MIMSIKISINYSKRCWVLLYSHTWYYTIFSQCNNARLKRADNNNIEGISCFPLKLLVCKHYNDITWTSVSEVTGNSTAMSNTFLPPCASVCFYYYAESWRVCNISQPHRLPSSVSYYECNIFLYSIPHNRGTWLCFALLYFGYIIIFAG